MRRVLTSIPARTTNIFITYNGEFDPGSGRTLAACLTHASQGERFLRKTIKLADGLVTRRQPALMIGITR